MTNMKVIPFFLLSATILSGVEFDINHLNKVEMKGVGNLIITQKDKGRFYMEDDDMFRRLHVDLKRGTLTIEPKERRNPGNFTAYLEIPRFSELILVGSPHVAITSFKTQTLRMELTGAASVSGNIETDKSLIYLIGESTATLSGSVRELEIELKGEPEFVGKALKGTTTDVRIEGAGRATVYAEETLSVAIVGAGSVRYAGNPTVVRQNISGTGTLNKL